MEQKMRRRKTIGLLLIIGLLLVILAGCRTEEGAAAVPEPPAVTPAEAPLEQPLVEQEPESPKPDLAEIKANEAGKVMILMYHVIGGEKEKDWAQTADNFRRDLLTLYNEGYALLDINDFVNNTIKVAAGRTPVVLTFDDGTPGHFRYLEKEDGSVEIDPDCAVGILLDFERQHPDFGRAAVFYINDAPFGQRKYIREKLQEMVDLGFTLGNHTLTHPKLNQLGDERVQKELALLAQQVEEAVSGYRVETLALPFGISPQNRALLAAGTWEGYTYRNLGVLKVGANPAHSPNHVNYDALTLPRVQASTVELEKWLEYFRKHPEERYISDGDPETVAVPQDRQELLNKDTLAGKELLVY
ncbi:MAG: polysaccharide deacetylase family protein [Clostridia bacterium]|jgi:hypothetical protein|nr:polysaccharide deacetylase family protein [Clostridia bacterium]